MSAATSSGLPSISSTFSATRLLSSAQMSSGKSLAAGIDQVLRGIDLVLIDEALALQDVGPAAAAGEVQSRLEFQNDRAEGGNLVLIGRLRSRARTMRRKPRQEARRMLKHSSTSLRRGISGIDAGPSNVRLAERPTRSGSERRTPSAFARRAPSTVISLTSRQWPRGGPACWAKNLLPEGPSRDKRRGSKSRAPHSVTSIA